MIKVHWGDGRGSFGLQIHSGPCLESRHWGVEPSCTLVEANNRVPWPAALEAVLMPVFGTPCTSYCGE